MKNNTSSPAEWQANYSQILNEFTPLQWNELSKSPEAMLSPYNMTFASLKEASTNYMPLSNSIPPDDAPSCISEVHWWGFSLIFNEGGTGKLQGGEGAVSAVSTMIALALQTVPGVNAAAIVVAAALAAGMALDIAAIQLADNGNGVHFNIIWPELAILIVPLVNIASVATMLIPYAN